MLIIKETQIEWDRKCPEYDFEACREKVAREFSEFYKSYPILPKEYEEVSVLGAYINWSAYVMPRGFLKRHAMLMSKKPHDKCLELGSLLQRACAVIQKSVFGMGTVHDNV